MNDWKSLTWIAGLTALIMTGIMVWDFTQMGAVLSWHYVLMKAVTILPMYGIAAWSYLKKQAVLWHQDAFGYILYTYSLYGMVSINMTYSFSFIETAFALSLAMTVSVRRYVIVNIFGIVACAIGHSYATEPNFVAPGMSFNAHSLLTSLILFVIALVTHFFIIRYRLRIMKLNERFALIGKQSSFLMHEIKTPLTRVVLNSDEDPDEEVLSAIRRDSHKIAAIVNSVEVLIHSPERITTTFQNFEWDELRQSLQQDYESMLTSLNISLRFEHWQGRYYGNKYLIYQLLKNTILNAIEAIGFHREKSAQIVLTLQTQTDRLQLRVMNTHSQIPAKNLPQIFEPHFTTKSSFKNRGLGLALVKTIIEAHQGTVTVDSKPDLTQFTFSFPLKSV